MDALDPKILFTQQMLTVRLHVACDGGLTCPMQVPATSPYLLYSTEQGKRLRNGICVRECHSGESAILSRPFCTEMAKAMLTSTILVLCFSVYRRYK